MSEIKQNVYAQCDLVKELNYEGIQDDDQELLEEMSHLSADRYKACSLTYCSHHDNEPFPSTHLIERSNETGETNVIAIPAAGHNPTEEIVSKDLIGSFEITQPVESYVVSNTEVSHYISSADNGKSNNTGVNSVSLINYQQTVVADDDE
ncbi:hypothetical protein N9R04_09715 [Staphylococcus sp. SQ8-PEA]|uniref:Uncharacterized protein n=1 Tax=Staphylococcus marylandisciuri TaxID=2981529 RepID=A0ABT2QSI7_9STAP|nr:hypothetical protein [Staphylococcus marylandisciuri]MCU5746954.1 hypothetical protein [Staphylococcus marylandisciuri]